MDPREKLRWIGEWGAFLDGLALDNIRERFPGASEREVWLRLAARQYDRETMIRVFAWDPAAHGA
jgi:hypothetical protein